MGTATRSARRPSRRKPAELSGADPTRAKLLAAAAEVFAEHGFEAATVREISRRAGANIAAVNYHFRDKLGLYTEVLRAAVTPVGRGVARSVFDREMTPEETLRAAIKFMISRIYGHDKPALPFRLMRHELIHPTPVLAQVVDEVLRPTYNRMRATIGAMLGLPPDHVTVRLCAHSVMGQVLFYPQARAVLSLLWPEMRATPVQLDRIADHIADFSLAYLRAKGAKQE
jgi:TetR/AcrR family transcriptional regulator, regulator of cefoperazone and chloramphenicol sensitivity